jgi:hypothetical protein
LGLKYTEIARAFGTTETTVAFVIGAVEQHQRSILPPPVAIDKTLYDYLRSLTDPQLQLILT